MDQADTAISAFTRTAAAVATSAGADYHVLRMYAQHEGRPLDVPGRPASGMT